MTGPYDRARLEQVVPGPDYPEVRPRSAAIVPWTLLAVAAWIVFVLAISAAASQRQPEPSSPLVSPSEQVGAEGPVWAVAGVPHKGPEAGRVAPSAAPGVDSGAPHTPGEASWYDDGPGLYGAVHSWRFGDEPYWVEVCRQDASATCVLVFVRDYMRHPTRAIDLSPDAFVRLWPGLSRSEALDRGVVDVMVRVTGAAATLPPTHEETP